MKRSLPAVLFLALSLAGGEATSDEPAVGAHLPSGAAAAAELLPALVAYAELDAHPGRFLGRRVRVHVQAGAWVERWDPFLTRFGSEEFRALDAWADEQRLWEAAEHAAPLARLFVRRGSAAEWALSQARTFDRFELELDVRSVLVDRPWVEVSTVRPLEGGWSEGALIHAARAADLHAKGADPRARGELERALRGPLHESARRALAELASAGPREGG
ncbi:MAG: hypothetical protein CMJ84_02505 [Planctomycetes bacterium]|nr:hypothetical protein [Planctomycetota bacterium]